MPKREGYEVIRFIERGNSCHVSLDYVEGITLYDWISGHNEIKKDILYTWIKEVLHQLVLFHRQKGGPDYGRLSPYNIIIMRRNKIALMSCRDVNSIRPLDKYFKPIEGSQNIDVYCLGKIIQFIMAHVQCEPHLSKREEYKLQRIVKKCLETNPKKRYESIHMVQMNFTESRKIKLERFKPNEFKMDRKMWLAIAAFIVIVIAAFAAPGGNVSGKDNVNAENIKKIDAESSEKDTLTKELFLQAGIDSFLENEDYEKSMEYFKRADIQEEKTKYYLELTEFMIGDKSGTDIQNLWEGLEDKLPEKEAMEIEEILALMRVYAMTGTREDYKKILELAESGNIERQWESLSGKLQKEYENYRARAYENDERWEDAAKCYTTLYEVGHKERDEEENYLEKSLEMKAKYIERLWKDVDIDQERKLNEIQMAVSGNPDIMKEESFVRFVNEKRIHIEEGKVWVEADKSESEQAISPEEEIIP